jgi:hypothetical protein
MNRETEEHRSAEMIAASQQTGDEYPRDISYGGTSGDDIDDIGATGAIDPDQPSPINTAAGFTVGGTGTGIEAGTDAALPGMGNPGDDSVIADVYNESRADLDFDPDADELGMGQDDV